METITGLHLRKRGLDMLEKLADRAEEYAGKQKSNKPSNTYQLRGSAPHHFKSQLAVLQAEGIYCFLLGPYYCVSNAKDYRRALKLFYDKRTPGWDSYCNDLVRLDICTYRQYYARSNGQPTHCGQS